jgi:hypothetical protein
MHANKRNGESKPQLDEAGKQGFTIYAPWVIMEHDGANLFLLQSSLGWTGHLAGDQMINLRAMILVIRETFIRLRPSHAGKALRDGVNSFAVLQRGNHIMHSNPRVFNARMAPTNAGCYHDVSVSFFDDCHVLNLADSAGRRKTGFVAFSERELLNAIDESTIYENR